MLFVILRYHRNYQLLLHAYRLNLIFSSPCSLQTTPHLFMTLGKCPKQIPSLPPTHRHDHFSFKVHRNNPIQPPRPQLTIPTSLDFDFFNKNVSLASKVLEPRRTSTIGFLGRGSSYRILHLVCENEEPGKQENGNLVRQMHQWNIIRSSRDLSVRWMGC